MSNQNLLEASGVKPAGCLYIVATPIGNLNDITIRALDVLKGVDLIAAEDTRHTRVLLDHFGIDKPLVSVHDHNEARRSDDMLKKLQDGLNIALVSDAGTPLISDPGYKLVRTVKAAGRRVTPVPGACAAIAAMCVSGLPSDRFRFVGFPPAKRQARRELVKSLSGAEETLVFYESPRRVYEFLEDLADVLGDEREVCVAKEITKLHERVESGSVRAALDVFGDQSLQRGEFVVLVAAAPPCEIPLEVTPEALRMLELAAEYLPPRQAAALVADITGLDRKRLYSARAKKSVDDADI